MHDLTIAAASADDVWLLDGGRLKAAGPAREVMDVARLELVFNTMFERVRLQSGRHALVSIAPGIGERTTMAEPVVAEHVIEAEPVVDLDVEQQPEEPMSLEPDAIDSSTTHEVIDDDEHEEVEDTPGETDSTDRRE
jgi:ABC-type glutathione transport system ATPase component